MKLFRKKEIRTRSVVRVVPASFRMQIIKGVLKVVLTALFFTGIYHLTRLPSLTISSVIVEGGVTIPHDVVRARALDALAGSYLLLIPKKFTYLYPYEHMLASIQDVPRIHDVRIEKINRTELKITFDEYMPYALWCAAGQDTHSCFFLSEDGYAFAVAPDLQGGALLRHYTEATPEIQEGQVIDPARLHDIVAFTERVENELQFRIASVVHKNNKDIEFYLHGGGLILAASGKDMNTTFDNLKTVLTSGTYKHIEPGNFKYVDVRFDNKVFVNEVLNPVATSTEDMLAETPEEGAAVASAPADDAPALMLKTPEPAEVGSATSSEALPE